MSLCKWLADDIQLFSGTVENITGMKQLTLLVIPK